MGVPLPVLALGARVRLSIDLAPLPLQSMLYLNTNRDRLSRKSSPSYQADYDAAINTAVPSSVAALAGFRDSFEGFPPGDKPTINWSLASWSHLRNQGSLAFYEGRKLLFSPSCSNAPGALYDRTWAENVRWRIHQAQLGGFPIAGWIGENEVDNTDMSYKDFVRDFGSVQDPADWLQMSAADQAAKRAAYLTAMDRIIEVARHVWEELRSPTLARGVDGARWFAPSTHPGWISSPTAAFPSLGFSNGAQVFTMADLYTHRNGLLLSYIDAVNSHYHRVQSRIEAFNGALPPDTHMSLCHAWRARDAGNAARVAAGLAAVECPVVTTEAGLEWASSPGSYSSDPHKLRQYRFGWMWGAMHWYGVSCWAMYSLAASGNLEQNLITSSPPFDAYVSNDGVSDLSVLIDITDMHKYDLDQFSSAVPNKSWELYNRPYSWGVYLDQNAAPTVAPPGCPTTYWTRVVMDGSTFACAPGGRNLIYRPVYFRALRPYRFTVEVQTTGTVALRARGYDKLNGLAVQSALSTSNTWTTIGVEFTPRQHNVQGMPNPVSALFALDHDGVGTASWRNPQITAL